MPTNTDTYDGPTCICGECGPLVIFSPACGWYPARKTDCHDCGAPLRMRVPAGYPDIHSDACVEIEPCARCAEQRGVPLEMP